MSLGTYDATDRFVAAEVRRKRRNLVRWINAQRSETGRALALLRFEGSYVHRRLKFGDEISEPWTTLDVVGRTTKILRDHEQDELTYKHRLASLPEPR